MRIVMLTPAFHPRRGGVERHVRRVSEELAALGHGVAVVTRLQPGAPAAAQLGPLPIVRLEGGIRAAMTLLRQHRSLLRGADVIHCHDAYPFLYWHAPLRPLLRLPRAYVTFHGYEGWPIPREALRVRRWVRRACAGALCAGGFIPRWYGTACDAVTYGGVDLPSAPPPEEPEARAVFVGRLEPDTGILDYLCLLALARQTHGLELPLDVCGDGSLRAEVRRVATAAGLSLRMHGGVEDPTRFLLGARFALVSGYLAMWEAMACGALVLALYDNPLKRDYLEAFPPARAGGEAGPLVEVCGSPAEGADRLAWLMAHPEEMRARAAAARALAAEQTWRRVAEQYLALWSEGMGR
jgi:glycosyltransferase involved in cell wall biosynthesis